MKNAMFQFYDGSKIIDDTDLITLDEAMALFNARKDAFALALDNGLDCQMCIWYGCEHDSDYRETLKDWSPSNVKYDGGHFWVQE